MVLSVNNYLVREVAIVALRVVMKFKYKAVKIDNCLIFQFPATILVCALLQIFFKSLT